MLRREEFGVLVKALKAVFTDPQFIPDKNAFEVYYNLLKDLDYNQLSLGVHKYLATAKKPPTIADLREYYYSIASPEAKELTELEAWRLVRRAISNSNYHAAEEFAKLPEACQRAVGNPDNLREWAVMDIDKIETVEQSHFIRNYRTISERIRRDQRLPGPLSAMIESFKTDGKKSIGTNNMLSFAGE